MYKIAGIHLVLSVLMRIVLNSIVLMRILKPLYDFIYLA